MDRKNTILIFTSLFFLVSGLIFVYKYSKYRRMNSYDDYYRHINIKKYILLYLSLSIMSFLIFGMLCLYGIYTYIYSNNSNNSRKSISEMILNETEQEKFFQFCDTLFDTSNDKPMIDQYRDMKTRAIVSGNTDKIGEVKNLCGNYAKSILNKK